MAGELVEDKTYRDKGHGGARLAPLTLRTGWRPTPFRQFIVKIHSRCDLACDHCYVYATPDQRWRDRPRTMSSWTLDQVAGRIADHARAHGLRDVEVVLHGGEPLLAGARALTHAVETIEHHAPATSIRFTMQTNAVRLDDAMLSLLRRHGIGISVSLDGDQEAQDRHRRRRDGGGSFEAVSAALARMSAGPAKQLFRGLLCTVDLRNSPVDTYSALLRFDPPAIDFLLPHANWSQPPPGGFAGNSDTPYADWLIAVFDQWYDAPEEPTRIRRFEEIISVLLGGHSRLEGVGLSAAGSVVIETDGSIETADSLTTAYRGAGKTGLHVSRDDFDAVLRRPDVISRQLGVAGLPLVCRRCPVRRVCGGGLRTHRYREATGFDNPSVYCPDLSRLISHIRHRLERDVRRLSSPAAEPMKVRYMSPETR